MVIDMSQDKVETMSLEKLIKEYLKHFFSQKEAELPHALYNWLISQAEKPLLEIILQQVKGNQCKAAKKLGISRGTLRARMKAYGLLV